MVLVWILLSVIIVSLISLIGALTLVLHKNLMGKMLSFLVSFAAGAMLSTAFLNLLPEAAEMAGNGIFTTVLIGIVTFFALETFLNWFHCHGGHCETGTKHKHHKEHNRVEAFTLLNLAGDGIHNFIDGMIIATSFVVNIPLGIATSIAVIAHEIPQEIGDFSILVYGGLKPWRALFYNFLIQTTAIAGALVAYFFAAGVEGFSVFLLPFAAGGFIYIATADLLPELHHSTGNFQKAIMQLVSFLVGVLVIYGVSLLNIG